MKNFGTSLKKFFASFAGRCVLTIVLYFLIMGAMLLFLTVFSAPIIAVFAAIAFAYFGWKFLNMITPSMFVFMPIGAWITYYIVKAVLSFFVGVFVAPWMIGKWLSGWIGDLLDESLKNPSPVTGNKISNERSAFEESMTKINHLDREKLELMHEVLLKYLIQAPVPFGDSDYLCELQEFRSTQIREGSIYGCKTYGEAEALNHAIVERLNNMNS